MERRLPGIEGTARVLARGAGRRSVVAVGQSLQDRDDTLAKVVASFAIGGPIAVLLASLLGYALAASGLRPVEAMRRRAQQVSLGSGEERLPLRPPTTRSAASARRSTRCSIACAARSSASAASWPTRATSCARRSRSSRPSWRERCAAASWSRRCARRWWPPSRRCDHLAQLAEDLLVVARVGEGELPMRPRVARGARAARAGVRRRFAVRARERGRGDPRRAPMTGARIRRRAPPRPGARQPRGQRAALRAGRDRSRSRRAWPELELEVSDEGAGFTPTSPSGPSSALPAATVRARATAPASGSRSCGRSPTLTVAVPRSRGAAARPSGSGCPTPADRRYCW